MYTAGGAAGAAAGVAVGGPVGGIVGGVVGKKTAGKFTSDDGPKYSENAPTAVGAYPHAYRVGNFLFVISFLFFFFSFWALGLWGFGVAMDLLFHVIR